MPIRYTLRVYDFGGVRGGAVLTRKGLSLETARRMAHRQARRGFRLFGWTETCTAQHHASQLAKVASLREQGDVRGARAALELARIIRTAPHWQGMTPRPVGGIKRDNWGERGGVFPNAYRSAVIELDRLA